MLGFEDDSELIGTPALDIVQEARREISKDLEEAMLSGSIELFSIEDVYEQKNGETLPVEVSVHAIQYDGKPAVQIIARDITERKKVEAEIWEYQNMLKQLSSDLILAEEAQRRNLAIVLHDHLGQSLAMAKIKITSVLKELEDVDLVKKLEAIQQDISGAVDQTRSLTYELSPPVLHELGFITALEWRLDKFTEETGIKTDYTHNLEEIKLRDEQEIILFRSVDEILKNIIKHAEASSVMVTAEASDYAFVVKIQDNGLGFDTSILKPQSRKIDSFGLFSIKERTEYLGGIVDIQSEINKGTTVSLTIPVSLDGI